jgi:hypothetical protein
VTGALWAAASGIGFGLFQSLNRRLQLAVAAAVLSAACVATGEASGLGDAPAGAIAAFAASGIVHFLLGWTFLNLSQKRIGAWVVTGGGRFHVMNAGFGLGCALMVSIGTVAAVAAYVVALALRGSGLEAIPRGALRLELVAAMLVAFATWWRWIALEDASVGVVLALGLLSVPVVLFLAPLVVGAHLENVTARVWAGSALVLAGARSLIAVG